MQQPVEGSDRSSSPIVEVMDGARLPAADRDWLQAQLEKLRPLAAPHLTRVTVKLVDDAQMSRLHGHFLADPSTTDVMTFADGTEVDLAICACEAGRTAIELGHSLREELLLYGLHGLLHAAGMDDRTPEQFARIHAEEDRLLRAIGLGSIFA